MSNNNPKKTKIQSNVQSENNIQRNHNQTKFANIHVNKDNSLSLETLFAPKQRQESFSQDFIGRKRSVPLFAPMNASMDTLKQQQILDFSESTITNHVLWRTGINVQEVMTKFKNFIYDFKLIQKNGLEQKGYYLNQLTEIKNTNKFIFNIDAFHINNYDVNFYRQLINYPAKMIPIMESTLNEIYQEIHKTSCLFYNSRSYM